MKNFKVLFSFIFLAIASISCSENFKELKIVENPECSLNRPTFITKASDSAIYISDRSELFELNLFSGMLKKIDFGDYTTDLYDYVGKITRQEFNDSTLPSKQASFLGLGDNYQKMLFQISLPVADSNGFTNFLPANIYSNGKDLSMLFNNLQQGSVPMNIPIGNFKYFLSDSIIITNCFSQYEKAKIPKKIPALLMLKKIGNSPFSLFSTIEIDACEKENIAAENNIMNNIYSYTTTANFAAYNSNIYFSNGGSIWKITNGKAEKITQSSKTIVAFKIEKETITTVEKNNGEFGKIVKYNLENGKQTAETKLPKIQTNKFDCCEFIDGKLYIIYQKEGCFYIAIC